MPITHFPNGVSAQVSSVTNASAGAGDLDCANLYTTGAIVGDVFSQLVTFSTASTAQVYTAGTPTFACNLIAAVVTVGSVSAVAAAYTVRGGSAGTVHVASVANTVTTAYGKEALAIAAASITTTAGLQITRAAQGTAGDTSLLLVFRRAG